MPNYLELEVSLLHVKPRIWRRFLLRATASFYELHEAIQVSFDWDCSHLWEFREPGRRGEPIAGTPDPDGDLFGDAVPDAARVKLQSLFRGKGDQCVYLYDFGDGWEHSVRVRGIVQDQASFKRRLLAGARACPPEDCGGVPGYARMVAFAETGQDPWGDSAETLAEWLGDWEPDAFDLDRTKKRFDR